MFATFKPTARRATVASAVIAAGIASLGVATPAAATSVPPTEPDSSLVILDAGDPSQTVDLRAQPALGSTATNTAVSTMRGTLTLTGTQQETVQLDVTTTVVEYGEIVAVDTTGMTMLRRVDSYDVTDNSDTDTGRSFASDEEKEALVGLDIYYEFSAANDLQAARPAPGVELTAEQQAALDVVVADGMDNAALPAEPVGVGGQWTAVLGSNTATYTVTSIAGGDYTLDVAIEGTAESFLQSGMPAGFDSVAGTVTAAGQIVGSVDDPLVRTVESTTDLDLVLSGANGEMTMDLTMTETETAVAG